ncbi:hypothetical protein RBB50_002907 [Rhinocladiella similis]
MQLQAFFLALAAIGATVVSAAPFSHPKPICVIPPPGVPAGPPCIEPWADWKRK